MKRYAHIITLTAIMQYCKMVQMITSRLSDMHEVLSSTVSNRLSQTGVSCVLSPEGPSDLKETPFTETHTILSLRRIYNHIYECTRILNFIFGLPILLDIFRTVTSLTSGSYSVVRLFSEPVEAVTTLNFADFVISRVTWMLIFLGTMISLTVLCGRAASVTRDISHRVQTFLVQSHLDSEAVEQLLLFSQQISTDGIAFTAAGFFVIDLSLLCTVLTSAVTYVIILIQFKSH
ncbi:hypothetical protein B7P43_G17409 [Cryptotermes secundus]|uniref:Gustatory receptor n=1 Tax=Cryptotermes secundus TaxID=105785 RepID=A0A2J7QY89_9NEOP|nr:hypothetical protein B7P43_G17409 [Cryptotermes secundus]